MIEDDAAVDETKVPAADLSITAVTDPPGDDATWAIQYAVVVPDGRRLIYGDQRWVAAGECVRDGSHPNGRIQRRHIRIIYGPWEDV